MSLESIIEIYKSWSHDVKQGVFSEENYKKCELTVDLIRNRIYNYGNRLKLFFIGNGGSNTICSHMAEDFLKVGNIRALALDSAGLMSCLENDYAHKDVYVEFLKRWWEPHDILFAISSSGTSKNILEACFWAKNNSGKIITFSANPKKQEIPALSVMGDINFYIPTSSYGCAEIYHSLLLHVILDTVVEK